MTGQVSVKKKSRSMADIKREEAAAAKKIEEPPALVVGKKGRR